ncbi:MAG: class I SAM-dependent methyltransferase [Myxococcota bacterium]
MIDHKLSFTAIHVAATRAAHLRFDAAPHLLNDHPALALIGAEYESLVDQLSDEAHWVLRENRLFIPLRARWAEDRLRNAFASGVRQYVILGAGMDSFAFRQPDGFEALSIIEIDHPATQTWKQDRIEQLGWPAPSNLQLIACDFEKTSMLEALDLARFDRDKPAFFSWMGVTYYLERPLAQSALSELSRVLAPGSEVVFDFLRPYGDLAERYQELEALSGQYLKNKGEPHVNKLRDHDVRSDVASAGFPRIEIETEETLRERYDDLMPTSIGLSERFGLAAACT